MVGFPSGGGEGFIEATSKVCPYAIYAIGASNRNAIGARNIEEL
jgi:hypothetical protein